MSSNKSTLSVSDCTSHDGRGGDILKMGYLKKLKVNFLFYYFINLLAARPAAGDPLVNQEV